MKTRISKILGVMLTVTMLASMFLFAAPVSAAPGDTEWFKESVPGSTNIMQNSDVIDIAVADASTIWVINNHTTDAAKMGVYKSTNAGQSFDIQTITPWIAGSVPVSIAVAPDNVNAVGVIAVNAGVYTLYITNDGGTNWSTLPALPAGAVALDVAVAPARSGTLLGREYFVALADPGATAALGDVIMIGANATWTSVSTIALARDFTSVVVSPNFLGDRSVVAVGTGVAGTPTALLIVNTATKTVVQTAPLVPAGATLDFGVAGGIVSSDISLPSNYDPTTSGGRRAYAAVSGGGPAVENDVYRVDNDTARALGAGLGATKSVAYSGTVDSGKLFAGGAASANVKFTDNPTTTSPTWTTTTKAPTGATNTILRLATDFATTNRIFAGTFGPNSAFSISNDAGVSFNGETFIDMNDAYTIQGIALTPDGKTFFMATLSGTELDLWKSATSVSGSKYSRILSVTVGVGSTGGLLAINPGWATTPALFLFDKVASGNIYTSQNGGDTFSTRMGPAVAPVAAAVQDANTVYMGATGSSKIYKTTNAAWTWLDGVEGEAGNVTSIIVPRFDDVIVGGTNDMSYSVDGGAKFTGDADGLSGTGALYVAADTLYSGNKTIYLAAATTRHVYRYIIGTSTQSEAITGTASTSALSAAVTGNGALYALDQGTGAVNTAYVNRTLNPLAKTAVNFNRMDAGADPNTAAFAAMFMQVASTSTENTVYVADNGKGLYAFKDWLAVSRPDLTSLADKANIAIDPVSGRGDPITIAFKQMGSGTGLVNKIDIEIVEKSQGLTGTASFGFAGVTVPATAPTVQVSGPTVLVPFRANTTYLWAIRAADTVNGEAIDSKWTAAREFTVQSGGIVNQPHEGPIITSPQGGAMNVDPKLVAITWAPISGATEYTVIVATDAALTQTVGGTPAQVTSPAFQVADLQTGTTYFYSVQATKPTVGQQAIGSFTTAKPTPTVAPTTPAPPTTPVIVFPTQPTPAYVWAIIVIGGVLILAVIILIVRTRRVP